MYVTRPGVCRVFLPLNSVFIFLFNFLTGQEFYRVFYCSLILNLWYRKFVFLSFINERIDDTFYYLRRFSRFLYIQHIYIYIILPQIGIFTLFKISLFLCEMRYILPRSILFHERSADASFTRFNPVA